MSLAVIYLSVGVATIAGTVLLARSKGASGGNGILILMGGVVWPLTWLAFILLLVGRGIEKLANAD